MDRELLQDSKRGGGSFWDGLGVEFEAKYIFDFRGAPRGGSGVRAGRGATAAPGRGATAAPGRGDTAAPGRGDTRPPPDGGTPPFRAHYFLVCAHRGGYPIYGGTPPCSENSFFHVRGRGGVPHPGLF